MELFERPAVFDDGDGEVVQKLRLGRELTLHAEVIEARNDAFAKEGGPMSIDDDTGGEGIFNRDKPAGKFETIFWEGFARWVEGVGEAGFYEFLRLGVFAAVMKVGGAGVLFRSFLHNKGGGAFESFLEGSDFVSVTFQFGCLKEEVFQSSLVIDGLNL